MRRGEFDTSVFAYLYQRQHVLNGLMTMLLIIYGTLFAKSGPSRSVL